jgi:teichuronic acid biosynthesis glycosyltransferase TuaC
MHILTLTSLFPNSLQPVHGVFVRNRMENHTRKFGHDFTVVAPVPYFPKLPFKTAKAYDTFARIPKFEEPGGYPIHHPRYLVTPKLGMRYYGDWMSMGVMKTIQEIHARHPIDVIDGHYVYPDGRAAIKIGQALGIPVVLSARGTDLSLFPKFPHILPILKANLEGCRQLICVCSHLKKVALELGIPENKVHVIGNGVDTALFHPGDKLVARKNTGLPATGKIVLSVGHLVELKGFHLIIAALAKTEDQTTHLVIVGEGPMRGELEALIQSHGLMGRVTLPGSILNRELKHWYQAADLFVLASSREGWPNVVCEAQATGLPVVATKVWGVPEIIHEPALGTLIDGRTVEALAAAIDIALEKAWDREHIAKTGSARTWGTVADQVEVVFNEVAMSHRAGINTDLHL